MTKTRRTVGLSTELDVGGGLRLPLTAVTETARRGRAHGFWLTLICQRAASLSWDVLSQAEVLVALRVANPRDVGAIEEWIKLHADVAEALDVKASLPIGTAWVWSPGCLETLQRVAIRARRTFDSTATPIPGSAARSPQLVTVDVDGLRAQLMANDSTAAVEPSTAEQVRQRWRAALKAGAQRMFNKLLELHPEGMSRREVAERVGIETSGGTFGTYLSTLRRDGLLTKGGGQLHAADVLLLAPRGQR